MVHRALPQLIPDGFLPEPHAEVALSTVHLFARKRWLPAHVQYTMEHQARDPGKVIRQRSAMTAALEELHDVLREEDGIMRLR